MGIVSMPQGQGRVTPIAWFVKFKFEACEPKGSAMHHFSSERYALYVRGSEEKEAFVLWYEGSTLFYLLAGLDQNLEYSYAIEPDDVPLPRRDLDLTWLAPARLTFSQVENYLKVAGLVPLSLACKREAGEILKQLEFQGPDKIVY